MEKEAVVSAVAKALDAGKPAKAFRECIMTYGADACWDALDQRLGDLPDAPLLRKIGVALDSPEADLREKSESASPSIRRISRLILLESLTGTVEDAQLHKGLSDPVARIRADTVKFVAPGADRTRLYNQLIRLIREDPDARVRAASGRRLAVSFADMYSVDFDGLPDLSKMLLLDALEGHTRIDEERAESLLFSKDPESSYRAARRLLQWGTLASLFSRGGDDATSILERCAELGVVDYLAGKTIPEDKSEWAMELAGKAGRQDLLRQMISVREKRNGRQSLSQPSIIEIESTVLNADHEDALVRRDRIAGMPLEDKAFKTSVEIAFPPPDRDVSSRVLFDMARMGHWVDWTGRVTEGLGSADPDIRCSAAAALASLAPERAAEAIAPMLTDPVERVRRASARAMASIPSGNGCAEIAAYLQGDESEEDRKTVVRGVRDAGGAALAKCILDNIEALDSRYIGMLLEDGIDEVGVELLVDGFTTAAALKGAASAAGPRLGESFLAAWNTIDESARKRVLNWISATGWAMTASGDSVDGARNLLKPLSHDEKHALFDPVMENVDGRSRRRLRKLMKNR